MHTCEHAACVCIHVSAHMCLSMYMNVNVCMCGGACERVYTHMQMLCCLADHAYYANCLAISHCAHCLLNPG